MPFSSSANQLDNRLDVKSRLVSSAGVISSPVNSETGAASNTYKFIFPSDSSSANSASEPESSYYKAIIALPINLFLGLFLGLASIFIYFKSGAFSELLLGTSLLHNQQSLMLLRIAGIIGFFSILCSLLMVIRAAIKDLSFKFISKNLPQFFYTATACLVFTLSIYDPAFLTKENIFIVQSILAASFLLGLLENVTRFFQKSSDGVVRKLLFPFSKNGKICTGRENIFEKEISFEFRSTDNIKVGDTFLVTKNDIVPVDSEIIEGTVLVQEKKRTLGEKTKIKLRKQILYAGSAIKNGSAKCVAISIFEDSLLMKECIDNKKIIDGHLSDFSEDDRYEKISSLAIVGFSIFAYIAVYLASREHFRAVLVANGILLCIFLPYAFSFSRLVSTVSLIRSFYSGFSFASTKAIRKISSLGHIMFNYCPPTVSYLCKITDLKFFDTGIDRDQNLSMLMNALALSKQSYLNLLQDSLLENVKKLQLFDYNEYKDHNEGISVKFISEAHSSKHLIFGTEKFVINQGHYLQFSDIYKGQKIDGGESFYLIVDNQLIARIFAEYVIFPANKSEIDSLRKLGINLSLISSARKQSADLHGKSLGFDLASIHSENELSELIHQKSLFQKIALFSNSGNTISIINKIKKDAKLKLDNILIMANDSLKDDPVITRNHADSKEENMIDIFSANNDIGGLSKLIYTAISEKLYKDIILYSSVILTLASIILCFAQFYFKLSFCMPLISMLLLAYSLGIFMVLHISLKRL